MKSENEKIEIWKKTDKVKYKLFQALFGEMKIYHEDSIDSMLVSEFREREKSIFRVDLSMKCLDELDKYFRSENEIAYYINGDTIVLLKKNICSEKKKDNVWPLSWVYSRGFGDKFIYFEPKYLLRIINHRAIKFYSFENSKLKPPTAVQNYEYMRTIFIGSKLISNSEHIIGKNFTCAMVLLFNDSDEMIPFDVFDLIYEKAVNEKNEEYHYERFLRCLNERSCRGDISLSTQKNGTGRFNFDLTIIDNYSRKGEDTHYWKGEYDFGKKNWFSYSYSHYATRY